MATLVYSEKCPYCKEIFTVIRDNPEIRPQIRVHDIEQGVPVGVVKVPSLIVGNDKILVGMECKNYLLNMVKQDEVPVSGSGVHFVSIDGTNECSNDGQYCDLMRMNEPKAAPMTKEFEQKMLKKVE